MDTQIRAQHELHSRRFSRNVGLGVALAVFVVLVWGLTVVKVGGLDNAAPVATAAVAGAGQ